MRQVLAKVGLYRMAAFAFGLAVLLTVFGPAVTASSRAAFTRLWTGSTTVAPASVVPSASVTAARMMPKATGRDTFRAPRYDVAEFWEYLREPALNAAIFFAPPTFSYNNQLRILDVGGSETINPTSGPVNATTIFILTTGCYNGGIAVNSTTGIVQLFNASRSIPNANQTCTITVRAVNANDDPDTSTDASFTVEVNYAPSFTSQSVTRTAGDPSANSKIIDNLNDDYTDVANLDVRINGGTSASVNGVTVSNLTRTNNMYFADIVAGCNASNATFTVTVIDGRGFTATSNLNVTVNPNPPPVAPTYNATPYMVNQGEGLVIDRNSAPSDNSGTVNVAVGNLGGYNGDITINNTPGPNFGDVTLSNAGPGGGTATIVISATDNCGVASFSELKVKINAPPSIAPATPAVRQGSSPLNQSLGTINDPEDPISSLAYLMVPLPGFPVNGVTINNLTINTTTGQVNADISATCDATNATFTLIAQDTQMLSSVAQINVTVLPNTGPVLSYPSNVTIGAGSPNTTINPTSGPSDNGTITSLVIQSYSGACGTLSINTTVGPNYGQLTLANAPLAGGMCTVTVRAVDNCNELTNATLDLNVTSPMIGISKTHVPIGAVVQPGEVALFQLNYSNTGTQDATGAILTETVPANTTFEALASAPGWSCADGAPAGTVCTYNIGNVGIGGAGSVFFGVRVVNPVGIGVTQVSNQFSYDDSITTVINSNVDNVPIAAFPDMTVTKTDNGIISGAGQTIPYFVSYANVGRRNAAGVVITETVPANTTFNAAASLPAIWSCANGSPAGTPCTINVGNVAGGGSGTFIFAVDVSGALPPGVTQVTNTVSINDGSGTDPVPSNNTSIDTTPVGNGLIVNPIAVGRTQGSPATNSTIATVTDILAPVSSVIVTTTAVPAGLTISNITNNGSGVINADIAAGCNAAIGPNIIGLKATDSANNMVLVNLTVNVAANPAPVLGVYPSAGPINPGASTTVTPSAGPTDNGSVASIVAAAPGFTGTFSVNPITGVVNVSNAGPSGTYTVTVTATDQCGLASTQNFTLIVNTPPTITPAAPLTFGQGSTTPGVAVATVGDINTPAGNLIVVMDAAPAGIILSNFVNTGGNITATVAISCAAAAGPNLVVLKVTDGGGLSTTANLTVNVTANTPPVQGNYSASNVNAGAGTTITPSAAPTDNALITSIVASAPGFTGGFNVNTATGVITVTNAGPMGAFTVTVTATDNCGATSAKTFVLTVNCAPFTVNSPGVATGTVNTPFSQSFTPAGGVAPFTFALTTGTLPAGLTLSPSGVLAGTPTQPGTFPITVTATDSNGCTGTSAVYTLVIACQTITVNPPATATGTVGVAFSQNFAQAGGVGAVSYTLNSGTIPTGMTLGTNGVLSGVPTQAGNFPITVKVTDANGCMGVSALYTLVISCQNIAVTPPVVNSGTVSAFFNQSFTQQGGVGTLTYTLNSGTLPMGLTLSTSGILAGTPTQAGSFPITVKVTDSNNCSGVSPTYTLVIGCQTITVTPPVVTTGTANTPFSQSFTQSAGLGAITYTINTGTLPNGLTLAPSGTLSGTPTQTGSFNITVKATDVNGCSGISASYTLIIGCQTITVTPPAVTTAPIGAPFNQSFTQASGIGAVTFTVNAGALPPGLTLSTAGVLSGTPTQLGSFPITVKVTDANGCMGVSATYTLVIGCQTITVTPPGVTTGTVGTLFSQSFAQTGGLGAVTFALESGVLPTGMTLATTGLLSGTPTQSGSFPITVKVTDVNGCTGVSAVYTLVINCQNITVNVPGVATGTVGVPFSQSFTQAGALGAVSYSLNSGALPPGLVLALNGTLAGTPTQAGTYPFTVKVTDANGCSGVSPTYTLVIGCPAITIAPATLPGGVYGDAYNQTVTATPAGIYEYTVSAGTLPPGLALNATSGAITGTPSAVGTYNFTITAKYYDNCPASKPYSIVISCPTVTLAPANLVTGTIGLAYSQTVSATPAGTYSFAVTGGALPLGVTLNTATGVVSGTPTLIGTYNFTITATGSGGLNGCTGSKDYTIIINCRTVTIAPTTLPGGKVAEPYSETVSATPANTYTFSLSNGSLPPGLTLNPNTGVISGTPTTMGTYNFSITATDPDTCPGTQAYSIVISCPVITLSPVTLPNGTIGVAYQTTNFVAAPAGTYSFAITSGILPSGLTLTTAGVLSGTPTQTGSFPLTITATDANQCTGSRSYTLFINTCPSITVDPLTVVPGVSGTAYTQAFSATGGLAPYTFTQTGSLPAGLSLSAAGVLSGTPTQTGTYNFTVLAKDANQCAGSRAYTLTVTLGCTFGINPNGQSFAVGGGTGTAAVIAASACAWTAASSDPWITITSGANGTGNGSVAFTVAPHAFVGTRVGTLVVAGQTLTVTQDGLPRAVKADFDGDGKTDFGVWRGSTGGWLNVNSSTDGLQTTLWGAGYAPYFDVPVPGDYDGDGKIDQAIWRGQDSIWYIRKSSDGQPILQYWGANYAPYNDVPTPGDYDGDGKTDLAVWRPSTGTWFVLKSSDGSYLAETWGQNGDTPVPGDYDGDGKTDLAFWRGATGTWTIKLSSGGTQSIAWGAGYAPYFDAPVQADYDGDGKTDLAIWRGQDSIWYIRKSSDGLPILQYWGANYAPYNDVPTTGDFDGDGKADIAVWRPTTATWFIKRSLDDVTVIKTHGQPGDLPVPAYGVR